MMSNSPITSTPVPLRPSLRQSLRNVIDQEIHNDDEAERCSLVASERVVSSTPASSTAGRDESISLTPQKEHYQGCLKLYAENKITKDNAWNLQLIDFMTTMLRRHDHRMENLQTASTVVDASARIYSFRVDAVHHDVLLMAGGLTKVVHTKRGKKANENADDEGRADLEAPAAHTKKKKRMKGAIATNPDVLNGDFETNLCIDPFFERLAATTGDVTSSNRAFNATLPIDDATLALMLSTDTRFLPPTREHVPVALEEGPRVTLPARLLPRFTEEDELCRPFTGFSISGWDPETEESETRPGPDRALDLSQQAVAFDMDADVEPIPVDEPHNDLYEEEPLGGIESEEEGDAAVAACVARAAPAPPARLTDMRPAGPADARLEYSYCGVLSAWAGPSHWRLKHNRASKTSERSACTGAGAGEGPPRRPARARRPLDFLGAGLAFEPGAEYEPALPAKIMISRKTLATGAAWNEANYKTPVDRGLDESFFRKLYLRRHVLLERKQRAGPSQEPDQLTVEEARDYDYNNENDASYCPLNMQEGDEWGHEEGRAAGAVHDQVQAPDAEDIGDMIEPPTKIAKIFIPYAMRAKKVDMKQLKQCTWRTLTEGGGEGAGTSASADTVAPTSFFSVYSRLPSQLSGEMRDSLTVPLALLAVLHLANEKGLVLEKRDDLKDIDILGLIQ